VSVSAHTERTARGDYPWSGTAQVYQVRIERAGEADSIFETLMGDVVEPRREFIQHNALKVVNLDV
jgi:DNA gyrase subunit B